VQNAGLGSWPARRARMTPDRPAFVFEDTTTTFADVLVETGHIAHALRGLGIGRGDRVAYVGANHPTCIEVLFAAGMLGATYVPVNARLTAPELEFVLSDSGASVLVHGAGMDDRVPALADAVPDLRLVGVHGSLAGGAALADLVADAPTDVVDEAVTLDDTAMIMYTSGTTGRPKGATLTHGNLTWNAVNVLVDLDLAGDDVALVTAPLFHAAALNMLALPTFVKGGAAVIAQAFDPGAAFDLIERHGVTFMFGVPAMYLAMAQHPRWADADLSSVRILECGGAPVPESLIRTYQERGLTFLQGYGMTEAAPGALFLGPHMTQKVGTAGVPSFFTDVRVVDTDDMPVSGDAIGEVQVKGPNVMSGYWNRPDATAEAIDHDGWFRSGDAATVDDDGYVTIADRIKDMYISGGENVYPAEVEAAILEHPDVVDCGVVGTADEKWGEVGVAAVVVRPGSELTLDQLTAFLDGRIARFKLPKHLHLVEELPRTGSGKIAKPTLREQLGTD
jgi:fatty-acyl-CoA synthase